MAAPTLVGSAYGATFGLSNPWTLTITNGFVAGNTILSGIGQTQSPGSQRTISSIGDGTANVYAAEVGFFSGANDGGSYIWKGIQIANAVAGGSTLTLTFSSTAQGDWSVQEISPATSASLTDTKGEVANTTSHTSGATGLTTSGDVLIYAVGCLNGTTVSSTAGSGYTRLYFSSRTHVQYQASAAGLVADTGPWTSGTTRQNKGVMAAFYTAGGGGGGPVIPVFMNQYRQRGN